MLPAVLTLHPVGTFLRSSRESKSQYPGIRVSKRQESSSAAVLSLSNSYPGFAIHPQTRIRQNNEEGFSHVLCPAASDQSPQPEVARCSVRRRLYQPSLSVRLHAPLHRAVAYHPPLMQSTAFIFAPCSRFTFWFLESPRFDACLGRAAYTLFT